MPQFINTPPHSSEAKRTTIGALLFYAGRMIAIAAILRPNVF